jgi:hypothetical protein
MDYIAAELERSARTRGWIPDVVAIESVAVHRSAYVSTALVMAETRGYLKRIFRERRE